MAVIMLGAFGTQASAASNEVVVMKCEHDPAGTAATSIEVVAASQTPGAPEIIVSPGPAPCAAALATLLDAHFRVLNTSPLSSFGGGTIYTLVRPPSRRHGD
jgi:hypothetical protein